ncbi:SIS domain-containing protein [Paenibacillus sp. P26]|nr:SIS domain-containing protein [Paenibacillus sp. P26]
MINTQPAVNPQVQLVLEEVKKRSVKNLFFVACGGSLAVMHPNKYFLDREADQVTSDFYNASEFITRSPRTLTDASVVILLSLTGTTPETTEAAVFAKSKGALTVGVTCDIESPLAKAVDHAVIYDNAFAGVPIEVLNGNFSVMYQLGAGIIDAVEGKDVLPRLVSRLVEAAAGDRPSQGAVRGLL